MRGSDLRVKDACFAAVVVNAPRSLVGQGVAGAVRRRRDDAADVRSPFDRMAQVEDCHGLPLPEAGFYMEVYKRAFHAWFGNQDTG